jgi:hypothetical protein
MRLTSYVKKSETKESNEMANLQKDESDTPAQPARLDNNSTPAERAAANRAHHQQLISHTLDAAEYGGHGHAHGRQGKAGHVMVPSAASVQPHSYIPQAVFNTSSDGAGSR